MAEGVVIDVRSKKSELCGRKQMVFTDEFLLSVPLYKRTTKRSYAHALNISNVTFHNLKKRGRLRTHTSSNHPALTSKHKIARMKWILDHLNPIPHQGNPTYRDVQQVIHIDEKCIYLNPETRNFYLLPTEEDPYRAQQSKIFKIKSMFEGMIGKPLYDLDGTLLHSVKYGIFPFVKRQQAKKKSKNKPAGTWETKAVESVTKQEIRDMLMNNIIPVVHDQWPEFLPKDVIIQWDNVKSHQVPCDPNFVAACTANGFKIQIIHQPTQSPDLNVLDVGLFRVIQSPQYQAFPETLDELIEEVEQAYEEFSPTLNKYTWTTLQSCMTQTLIKEGGNNYKTPHMGKARLDRLGLLPEILQVDKDVVREAVHHLDTVDSIEEIQLNEGHQGEVDVD